MGGGVDVKRVWVCFRGVRASSNYVRVCLGCTKMLFLYDHVPPSLQRNIYIRVRDRVRVRVRVRVKLRIKVRIRVRIRVRFSVRVRVGVRVRFSVNDPSRNVGVGLTTSSP